MCVSRLRLCFSSSFSFAPFTFCFIPVWSIYFYFYLPLIYFPAKFSLYCGYFPVMFLYLCHMHLFVILCIAALFCSLPFLTALVSVFLLHIEFVHNHFMSVFPIHSCFQLRVLPKLFHIRSLPMVAWKGVEIALVGLLRLRLPFLGWVFTRLLRHFYFISLVCLRYPLSFVLFCFLRCPTLGLAARRYFFIQALLSVEYAKVLEAVAKVDRSVKSSVPSTASGSTGAPAHASTRPPARRPRIYCYACGAPGHTASRCFKRFNNRSYPFPPCTSP